MADCCSNEGVKLIYACSGAADVGELADKVARKLRNDGFGRMTCLAGIGADISGFVESARGADENITIDGCPTKCAKKALERIGVKSTAYVLSNVGFKKGESPVTPEAVDSVVRLVKSVPPKTNTPIS
jgi:uncharacterized metal-binding protein